MVARTLLVVGSQQSNVILTGFMASGKSSVGRALAHRRSLNFVDTDAMKRDDLDDEKDGEWEAPMKDNDAYMDDWSAKRISNSAYKGFWEAKKFANPEFEDDGNLYK